MPVEKILEEVRRHTAQLDLFDRRGAAGAEYHPAMPVLREAGYRLHIETNGAIDPDPALYELIEHWTVSPKRRTIAAGLTRITEFNYVVGKTFRQDMVEESRAEYIYLQPESSNPEYTHKVLEILMRHPNWRLWCRIHRRLKLP